MNPQSGSPSPSEKLDDITIAPPDRRLILLGSPITSSSADASKSLGFRQHILSHILFLAFVRILFVP